MRILKTKASPIHGSSVHKHTTFIPKNKSAPFIKIFDSIAKRLGGNENAERAIRVTSGFRAKMLNGEISTETARKILNYYNDMKSKPS